MSDPNTKWRYSIHDRDQSLSQGTENSQSIGDIIESVSDPVVRALLEQGSVTAEQVSHALHASIEGKELWRVLLRVTGVNRDLVFAEAASQSQIETCDVNAWEPPDDLVQSILGLFGAETVQLIVRAGLLPVEVLADEAVDDFTLSFTTPDPTSQAAIRIAASLGVKAKFSFSPESIVQARIGGLGYQVSTPTQDIGAPDLDAGESSSNGASSPAAIPAVDGTALTSRENRPPEPRNGEPQSVEVAPPVDASQEALQSASPTASSKVEEVDAHENSVLDTRPGLAGLRAEEESATVLDSNPISEEPASEIPTVEQTSASLSDDAPVVVDTPSITKPPIIKERDSQVLARPAQTAATPTVEINDDASENVTARPRVAAVPDAAAPQPIDATPAEAVAKEEGRSGSLPGLPSLIESISTEFLAADPESDVIADKSDNASTAPAESQIRSEIVQPTAQPEADVKDIAPPSEAGAKSFSNPYVELLPSDDGGEFLVEDVFADIESAITILDDDADDDARTDPAVDDNDYATATATETQEVKDTLPPAGEEAVEVPATKDKPDVESKSEKTAKPKTVVETPEVPRDRVVVMLLHKQAVTKEQVAESVRVQRDEQPKEALWRLLAQVSEVDRDAVYAEAASVYAFPMADISDPDPNFARLVMETFSEERREMLLSMGLLPLEYDMDTASGSAKLVFATHDPARPDVHRLLQQLKLGRFELKYAPESEIKRITHDIFPRRNEYLDRMTDDPMAMDLGTEFDQDKGELIDEEALEAEISRSTLINLFEATLLEATRSGASDIHIWPNPQRKVEIHFRTDGRLKRWHLEDKVHPEAFLAVVKDNSTNVDRFERDAAQDGFIQRRIDDALIRFRVSVLPIATASQEIRAESIVIRVLDDRKVLTDLRKLGMLDVALERFDKAIRQPHGMVILTGPTGSGKSTTLVAALHQVVTPAVNVLTVEDPVEYIINGVRQIKLSTKLNLEQALRSILRHDPDVVMVGEMRDQQTAELAIKLANTGHLTFSTLHTNDAPSAISRLYKMGIEPFLIAYAINLVVAQRLLRTLCPNCKSVDEDPDIVLMKSVGFSDEELHSHTFYKAENNRSCRTCNGTGYKGRRAMCETLYFSRAIRHMVVESGEAIDEDSIRELAKSEGMLTLQDSAREIVKMGETSMEELIRCTSSED